MCTLFRLPEYQKDHFLLSSIPGFGLHSCAQFVDCLYACMMIDCIPNCSADGARDSDDSADDNDDDGSELFAHVNANYV